MLESALCHYPPGGACVCMYVCAQANTRRSAALAMPTDAWLPCHYPRHCRCCRTRSHAREVARWPHARSPAILRTRRGVNRARHRSQQGGQRPQPAQGTRSARHCRAGQSTGGRGSGNQGPASRWLAWLSCPRCGMRRARLWAERHSEKGVRDQHAEDDFKCGRDGLENGVQVAEKEACHHTHG